MAMMDNTRFEKTDFLIFDGKTIHVDNPTILWEASGLEVKPGHGSRKRSPKFALNKFVWHWTGGENDIRTLFHVLAVRELGVEFAIDVEGVIWQFCDPVRIDTWDASFLNRYSMGCEIVNYGFTTKGRPVPKRGELRDTYQAVMRGQKRTFARFYPAQINAAVRLAEAASTAVPAILRQLPSDGAGRLLSGTMSHDEAIAYVGHLGHFQLNDGKSDPGFDLFEAMLANDFKLAA